MKNGHYRWLPIWYDEETEEIMGRNPISDIVLDILVWFDIEILEIEEIPIWIDVEE